MWDVWTMCSDYNAKCHMSISRTIEDLLCKNADYLINSISLKLRHLRRHPQAPRVLQVLVAYSSREILPLVDGTVYEVRWGTVVDVEDCSRNDLRWGGGAIFFCTRYGWVLNAWGNRKVVQKLGSCSPVVYYFASLCPWARHNTSLCTLSTQEEMGTVPIFRQKWLMWTNSSQCHNRWQVLYAPQGVEMVSTWRGPLTV